MKAEKNNVVSLTYELRSGSEEGEVVESLTEEHPLTFLFGTGGLLPKFEENINGLKMPSYMFRNLSLKLTGRLMRS
jgi:FKBP-type peptidyl-prolyl cis-trans isomerase SlyD